MNEDGSAGWDLVVSHFPTRMMTVQLCLFAVLASVGWAQLCVSPVGVRNYAKYSEVTQSSTYGGDDFKAVAGLAIDGNDDNKYSQHSCSHTGNDFAPWYNMDMKESIPVGAIVITNRGDCCQQRLLGAEILVGDSPNRDNPVCDTITDVSDLTNVICCNGMVGRYVTVRVPDRNEHLTICEFQVFKHIEAPDVKPEDVVEEYK
ncbi:fucolectin-1-like [Mixophyes fleayi]|uniref:fucolectin-1-like n=1 Tax=Mixophyes fleayi TaxID=3061075 RepID=UPI003F4E0234